MKTTMKTAAALLLTALAAGGCGGSNEHASTRPVGSGPTASAGTGGCLLAWNSGAPASAHRRLTAGSRPLHRDASVERWAAGSVTAQSVSGGAIAVSNGNCVIANAHGVTFVQRGGAWTEVQASSQSDSLYRIVSDAQALPNATYSAEGLLASTTEPGP